MEKARLTFLGTGTSQGVPMIGCDCEVCSSDDPRDKRLRASVLVEYCGLTILVDAGPDFRQQMLRQNVRHLDAILLTHNHKDHTGGLDDVRSFNLLEHKAINIWCQPYVIESLKKEYSYAFTEVKYPGAPEWRVHSIDDVSKAFEVKSNIGEDTLVWESAKGYHSIASNIAPEDVPGAMIVPILGWHHKQRCLPVLGYRFGNIAYMTDINSIDDSEIEKLEGVDFVTVNCVKKKPHYSHFSLEEALEFFSKVGAKESYITHVSHMLPPHAVLEAELPQHVHLAYDGLVLE